MIYDAVVVGGSVAGSIAARELARKGLAVALVEKARFPRPKACGEGLLPHGVAALAEMGLEVSGVPVKGIRYVSPSGVTAEADFPKGHGLVVRRERFDARLCGEAAATRGVTLFAETTYEPRRFRARWVIAADGLHSSFHKRPGITARPPADARIGLSTHVRGLAVDPERVEVLLHETGEVYVAPSDDGEALVACLFWADRVPPGPNEERVLSVLGSLRALEGRRGAISFTTPVLGAGPLGLHVEPLVAGNVVLVGDAAGAPDPVTGEGMSLALLSAKELANAIAAGEIERYETARRALAMGSEWLSRWILRSSRRPAVADRVVASLARHPEVLKRFVEVAVGMRRPPAITPLEMVFA